MTKMPQVGLLKARKMKGEGTVTFYSPEEVVHRLQ